MSNCLKLLNSKEGIMESNEVSYDELKSLIEDSYKILWVGSFSDDEVKIRLGKGGRDRIMKYFNVKLLPLPRKYEVIKHIEATSKPLSFFGPTWQRRGWLRSIRLASMFGINIMGNCKTGVGNIPEKDESICTMGYDIEVSMSTTRPGEFPAPYSTITSIALWCSCGYCKAWTTIVHKPLPGLEYSINSEELVSSSLNEISSHMPVWLVGYNCYQFDNSCLLYHASDNSRHLFRPINVGNNCASKDAFYLDIEGVNNVDLYCYLDKVQRHVYKALGLDHVARQEGLEGKTKMPSTDSEDSVYELVKYNINDSRLTSLLWHKTGACVRVVSSCVISGAPIIDCVRMVTGTMVSCYASSYLMSMNKYMDWSTCDLRIGYEGGMVLNPIRSLIRNVIVCDFSSMYPSIILDIGISPENIEILGRCSKVHEDKIIHWTNGRVLFCIKGRITRFDRIKTCLSRQLLSYTISLRKKYRSIDPLFADELKRLANSFYGALGYANSPLHSPRCAASVTVVGRTALALAYRVFKGLGLIVSYGDTDSCFLSSDRVTEECFKGDLDRHVDTALHIFHRILSYTPFPNMRMEKEKTLKSIILIDKKHYAFADFNNNIYTKGLSSTRKDRIGVCRDMVTYISKVILLEDDTDIIRTKVAAAISIIFCSASSMSLDMYSISKEVRYEGNTCYRYTNGDGIDVNIPVSRADRETSVIYDKDKVLEALERDINKLTTSSGIGTVKQLLMSI